MGSLAEQLIRVPDLVRKLTIADLQNVVFRAKLRRAGILGKAGVVGQKALRRIKAAALAIRALQMYGSAVQQKYGVSLSDQFIQLLLVTVLRGYRADDYYRYRMYRDIVAASSFVPVQLHMDIRRQLYEMLQLKATALADKRIFYHTCAEKDLCVPETLADFDRGSVRWWGKAQLPHVSLFSKEAASLSGAGASLWIYIGANRWRDITGTVLDESTLISLLCKGSQAAPLLLQRQVENHPDLADLGPSGLCTVRVVTIRHPMGMTPEILIASFRIPAVGGVADNFSTGGTACPVDLDTGVLGPGVRKDLHFAHLDLFQCPDTGVPIAGRVLPCWSSALTLALKTHSIFPEYPSVGWDIAITPTGPVLIEGNYNWGSSLVQQAGCRPLGETQYTEHMFAWARTV